MRLFGKVDSGINSYDRAQWLTSPFDKTFLDRGTLSRECMERREQRRLRQEVTRTLHHRTYQLPAGKTLAAVDLEIGDVIPHEPLMEIVDSEMIEERVLDPRTGRIRIMPSRRVRCVGEEVAAWAD